MQHGPLVVLGVHLEHIHHGEVTRIHQVAERLVLVARVVAVDALREEVDLLGILCLRFYPSKHQCQNQRNLNIYRTEALKADWAHVIVGS